MASNFYTITTVDGKQITYRRPIPQGRRPSLIQKSTATIAIHTTPEEKENFKAQARAAGMTESKFASLALWLGLKQLSVTDNCSTQ